MVGLGGRVQPAGPLLQDPTGHGPREGVANPAVDGRRWLPRVLGRGVARFGKATSLWRPVAKTSLKFLSQP